MRIHVIQHDKRLPKKPNMIISVDAEKHLKKNPISIPNENPQQTKNRKELFQPDICIYKKPTANLPLMVKKNKNKKSLDAFP